MILYRISPDALRRFLDHVIVTKDEIVAAAPVDSDGHFLDDGTYSDNHRLIEIVTLDANSTDSLRSNVEWGVHDAAAAPAIRIDDGWHVTSHTIATIAELLDHQRRLHSQVATVRPSLGEKVPLRATLEGIVTGVTAVPTDLAPVDRWPATDLPRALRALAALNYLSQWVGDHCKTWEPGFQIRRQGPQWHITFRTYQFDDAYSGGREQVFAGTWDQVTEAIHTAVAELAQRHNLTPSAGYLDVTHPLARLTTRELLSLPDDVELYLAPSHLRSATSIPGVRNLLESLEIGLDTQGLIEFVRYAVSSRPTYSTIGEIANLTTESGTPSS